MNKDIVGFLKDLRKECDDAIRKKALQKAAESIGKYPLRITSGSQARNLAGVGDWISGQLDTFLAEQRSGNAPEPCFDSSQLDFVQSLLSQVSSQSQSQSQSQITTKPPKPPKPQGIPRVRTVDNVALQAEAQPQQIDAENDSLPLFSVPPPQQQQQQLPQEEDNGDVEESLAALTLAELKTRCRDATLPVTGTKADLMQRLQAFREREVSQQSLSQNSQTLSLPLSQGEDYGALRSMTVARLRDVCKERNLKWSGTKGMLLDRLTGAAPRGADGSQQKGSSLDHPCKIDTKQLSDGGKYPSIRYRSASYALMLSLFEFHEANDPFASITITTLFLSAQKYTSARLEASRQPSQDSGSQQWFSGGHHSLHNTLVKGDLVVKTTIPQKGYRLTELGMRFGQHLWNCHTREPGAGKVGETDPQVGPAAASQPQQPQQPQPQATKASPIVKRRRITPTPFVQKPSLPLPADVPPSPQPKPPQTDKADTHTRATSSEARGRIIEDIASRYALADAGTDVYGHVPDVAPEPLCSESGVGAVAEGVGGLMQDSVMSDVVSRAETLCVADVERDAVFESVEVHSTTVSKEAEGLRVEEATLAVSTVRLRGFDYLLQSVAGLTEAEVADMRRDFMKTQNLTEVDYALEESFLGIAGDDDDDDDSGVEIISPDQPDRPPAQQPALPSQPPPPEQESAPPLPWEATPLSQGAAAPPPPLETEPSTTPVPEEQPPTRLDWRDFATRATRDTTTTTTTTTPIRVILIADQRERANGSRSVFSEKLTQKGVICETRQLEVGDFTWVARDAHGGEVVLGCVVERKTAGDLAKSITGGRYTQQKARLRQCMLRRVVYLLEGPFSDQGHIQAKALETALMTTSLCDGFFVEHTRSLEHTIAVLVGMTASLAACIVGCTSLEEVAACNALLEDVVVSPFEPKELPQRQLPAVLPAYTAFEEGERGRRGDAHLGELFARQLSCIHGVGGDAARAIANAHHSPYSLWCTYQDLIAQGRSATAELCLSSISVGSGRVRSRFVGERASSAVFTAFTAM